MSPSVDLQQIAEYTEGYSGADLQGLVYNANMDAIHSALPHFGTPHATSSPSENVEYISFGGSSTEPEIQTEAEKTAFQRRVCRIMLTSNSSLMPGTASTDSEFFSL